MADWKKLLFILLLLVLETIPILGVVFALIATAPQSWVFDYLLLMGFMTFVGYLYLLYQFYLTPSGMNALILFGVALLQVGLTALSFLFARHSP